MKIYSIEIFNLNSTGCHSGQPIPKGCLGVVVDRCDFKIFHELPGGIFYSNCEGLLNIYKNVPGSKDGFAGRSISLAVMEPSIISKKIMARRVKTFKGSLWSSWEADQDVAKYLGTNLTSIGVKASNDKYRTYCSVRATDEFINRLASVVVLGKPESSPLL